MPSRLIIVSSSVALAAAATFLSITFLQKKQAPQAQTVRGANLANVKVASWDPSSALLSATLADGRQAVFKIEPPGTVAVIPISAPGQPKNETILFNIKKNQWWRTAFCGGDALSVTIEARDVGKLSSGGAVVPKEVRSSGPRACAF